MVLSCFKKYEQNVQLNVQLMGAIVLWEVCQDYLEE